MIDPVIHGLSNEAYHHEAPYSEYLSSSQLKTYLKSPRYFKHQLDNPTDEKSDALRFGSLFHLAMEKFQQFGTIDAFYDCVAIFTPPKNDKTGQPYGTTTKAYAEAYKRFLTDNQGKEIATLEEARLIDDMVGTLVRPSVGGATARQVLKLLKWGKEVETSYFHETEDGIKLKVRPDLLTASKVVDWKTCSLDSLDEDSIARQIIKYRYDVSLAMYQWTIFQIEKKWYAPILVFVQKQEPFDCVMCDISEWCYQYFPDEDFVKLGVGAMEFRKLLDLHTECVKNNEWPGAESSIEADGNTRIMKPAVPYWLGMKYFEEF